jgi:hypothetical protein
MQAFAAGTVVATLFALVLGMLVPPAVIILGPGDAGYPFDPPLDDHLRRQVVGLAITAALAVGAAAWHVLVQHRPLRAMLWDPRSRDWAVVPALLAMGVVLINADEDWPRQASVGAEPGQIAFISIPTNAAAQMIVCLLAFWTVFAAIDLTRRAIARRRAVAEAVA